MARIFAFFRLTLWLVLFALAAILSALKFWLLPHVDRLRHQLEYQLSQRLEQSIHIQHLKARLDGITPELRLLGVAVGSGGEKPLLLREIQLGIDLPASLQQGGVQFAWIRVLGAHIEVRPTPEGHFRILGLGDGEKADFPRWLLADGHLELLHSTLVWHAGPNIQAHTWHDIHIRLDNRGQEHRLQLRFQAPGVWADQVALHAHFRGDSDTPERWQVRFLLTLEQLQLAAFTGTVLGVHSSGHGNARIHGTWRPGQWDFTAEVDLHQLEWQSPWLQQPLKLHQASGRIHGHRDKNGWRIDTPSVHLANSDFDVYARLRLDHSIQNPFQLEARAWLARLNLANLDAYLPHDPPAGLAKWLAHKPLHGLAQGHLLWRGRLQDFPFRDHSGVSEAYLTCHQTTVTFDPHWPALTEADLHLEFNNGRLAVAMRQGKLAGAPIDRLTAKLDLASADPELAIRGRTRNSVTTVLRVLQRSPLQPAVDTLARWTRVDGRTTITLGILFPLNHPEALRIHGRARVWQGSWRLLDRPLQLENLRGEVHFTQQRMGARLTGRLQQEPARMEITADTKHSRLTLTTRADAELLPAKTFRQYLAGATEVLLALDMDHDRKLPPRLRFKSSLQGIAVHLPHPLGKPAELARPLQLNMWLQSTSRIPLTLDYGPLHAALAINRDTHRVSGRIGLGQPPPPPGNAEDGLILTGHLDRFPLTPWLALWRQWPTAGPGMLELKRLDLRVRHLQTDTRDHGRHHIRAWRLESGWEGRLTTPYMAGDWSWNTQQRRLNLILGFVDLDALKDSFQDIGQAREPAARLSVDRMPAFTLRILHLRWHHHDLGSVNLQALPQPPGRFSFGFSLTAATHQVEASGVWHTLSSATRMRGRFQSSDLGGFLTQIGHPTALVQTPTTIDFQLQWPAAPYRFSISELNGHAQINMGPGRWLDIEPGAGRLLGLLYLGTLERRLRLDFSDLFQAGLAYERISGHIRLEQGKAHTDDLLILAVPARIYISGHVDLINQQVDEYVTLFPNTPVTLSLLSERPKNGLGKMAGAAQRLFNAPLDSIIQSQYAIRGTWDDPEIVLLRRSLPGTLLHGIWSELKGLTGNRR